jgi:acetyl esterase/lipase
MFSPAGGKANGTAMIVAPGGAFHFLMMDHEGYDMARWLTELGVTAFVLKSRLQRLPDSDSDIPAFLERLFDEFPHVSRTDIDPPSSNPKIEEARVWGEEDGRQAIRYVRAHSDRFGIHPSRIGIMGFSAGGGIAVNAALEYDEESRPDFVAGIYPGYRIGPPVPRDAPPLFITISDDDSLVGPMSATRLYESWHKAGAPVELHVFANGGHGYGTRKQDLLSDAWIDVFEAWLTAL